LPNRRCFSRSRSGSPARPRRFLSRTLAGLILVLVSGAWPVHAQAPALSREPAIARDEARRLIPGGEELAPSPERLEMAPGEQRRRLNDLRQALNPAPRSQAIMRMRALEGYLDYDEQDQIVYGPGRTRITYREMTLEADHVLLDSRLQEIQAEGNVELQARGHTVYAQSLRYNFDQNEGVAYNARGQYGPVYFRTHPKGKDKAAGETPQFQVVSEHEALFRHSDVTTCDFKVPHYYVRGREVVLFPRDRVFLRGATFYVAGVPIFYLPIYTRSLFESSPWFVQLGYNSRSGARIRLGYSYAHRTAEPSFEDDKVMQTRSQGRADLYMDYLSKLGPGLGFDYTYNFEYGKHKGELSIYGLSDKNREVFGATLDSGATDGMQQESERWRFLWRHRTELTEDLTLLFNIDEFSDPDIFYDVLDLFNRDDERYRDIQRRARVALTFVQEAYVVRLMADVKDRIGLDRLNNFSDPTDNNRDFDLDPYDSSNKNSVNGIGSDRWGRVSSKLPQFDAATRWLPFGGNPWFYRTELHLYNALDKGLNIVNDRDNAYVHGVEFYQQLMRQWKLSQRTTLLGKVGVGVGVADRATDLGYDVAGMGSPLEVGKTFPRQIDGLTFVDPNTFLIGTRRRSLEDINPGYLWGDMELQLNTRFSDALRGWLRWRLRKTTDDFLGDWYASLGSRTVREDLYNYKLREHWLEGRLDYSLFRPLLSLYTGAGVSLEGRGNLYPQEPSAYWNAGGRWTNLRRTLVLDAGVGLTRRQLYDPSDPRAVEENEWYLRQALTYAPVHQRWYLVLDNSVNLTKNQNAAISHENQDTIFYDEQTHGHFDVVYGREIGPKWNTEFKVAYDYQSGALDRVSWLLQRDLHDAIAELEVRAERNESQTDNNTDKTTTQIDVRTGLKFKLPGKEAEFGRGDVRTLRQQAREPALAY
jgi:hypothetical protein